MNRIVFLCNGGGIGLCVLEISMSRCQSYYENQVSIHNSMHTDQISISLDDRYLSCEIPVMSCVFHCALRSTGL